MAASSFSRVKFSLYEQVRTALKDRVPVVRCTKATLVHLSHTLEDMVLSERIPALLFTGFQESTYWRQETERYLELSEFTQQVCIFAGKPLPAESNAAQIHVVLEEGDPLRQEWFVVILSNKFSVVLCGQDNLTQTSEEDLREFDSLWSFEPGVIDTVLDLVEQVVAYYRPDRLAQLQQARQRFATSNPDAALITRFTLELVRFQEQLRNQLYQSQKSERATVLALQQSEALYSSIFTHAPDSVFMVDVLATGQFAYSLINPATERSTGYSSRQVIGIPLDEIAGLPAELVTYLHSRFMVCIRAGKDISYEETIRFQGKPRYFLTTLTPIRSDDGTIIKLLGVARDITDRKHAEDALAQSEERFRQVVASISSTIYVSYIPSNQDVWANLYVSPNMERLIGYPAEAFLENPKFWSGLVHPEDTLFTNDHARRLFDGEDVSLEYRVLHREGYYVWIRSTARSHVDEHLNGIVVYGVLDDVTAWRQAQAELAASEERFREMVASISHTLYVSQEDVEGNFRNLYVSPNIEQLCGYPAQRFMDNGQLWASLVHPDDHSSRELGWTLIREGKHSVFEYRIRHADGRWVNIRSNTRVVVNPQSGIRTYYGVLEDITERLRAEEALRVQTALQNDLENERELNRIKGNLMTMISHEFRTPLATILTSTEMMERYFDRMEAASRAQRLLTIRSQVEHLREMLDDITAIIAGESGALPFTPVLVSAQPFFERLVAEAWLNDHQKHHLVLDYNVQPEQLFIDPKLVRRIMLNLMSNAIKYSPPDTEIRCVISEQDHALRLEVHDQGIGIPPEDRPRLFQAFHRGSNIDQIGGTGLGLRLTQDFVRLHGGEIHYQTEVNVGTTFIVLLPLG